MKTFRAVLITLICCILAFGAFMYFFVLPSGAVPGIDSETLEKISAAKRVKTEYHEIVKDPLALLHEGLDSANAKTDYISKAVSLIDANKLYRTMDVLCNEIGNRVSGEEENDKAKEFLVAELESYGYEYPLLYTQGFYTKFELKDPVEIRGDYFEPDDPLPIYRYSANVIAKLPNADKDAPIILITCHFDSADTDAPIDNGSGVALVLEMARIFKENDLGLNCELRFCFFSGEEQGLHGAFSYMASLDDEEYEKIIAAVNIDMAIESTKEIEQVITVGTDGGYDFDGQYIVGTKTIPQENRITYCARYAYAKLGMDPAKFVDPYVNTMTDSVVFHRYRKDTVTVSVRERNPDGTISAPEYIHTDDDTMENTVFNSLVSVTRFVIATTIACDQSAVIF